MDVPQTLHLFRIQLDPDFNIGHALRYIPELYKPQSYISSALAEYKLQVDNKRELQIILHDYLTMKAPWYKSMMSSLYCPSKENHVVMKADMLSSVFAELDRLITEPHASIPKSFLTGAPVCRDNYGKPVKLDHGALCEIFFRALLELKGLALHDYDRGLFKKVKHNIRLLSTNMADVLDSSTEFKNRNWSISAQLDAHDERCQDSQSSWYEAFPIKGTSKILYMQYAIAAASPKK